MTNIKIKDLSLTYKSFKGKKNRAVVCISNFEINTGEIIGFFGPNHVGKSTLLKYISQLHSDFNININAILYDNEKFDKANNKPLILYVPQDYNTSIFPWLSIKDNLRILMKSLRLSDIQIENHITNFCTDFGYKDESELLEFYGFYKKNEFKKYEPRKISELSGGQKQILTVIRTLATSPNLITMDEPFSALDTFKKGLEFRTKVFDYLKKKHITTIIVAHELEEIIGLTDKVIIFNYNEEGRILTGIENSNIEKSLIETKANELKNKYGLNHI